MYSSYTAASFARKHDLAARHQVNFEGAVTWAFEFEDQPYFDGFRDLATNGIGKPVLNVFRMFGLMGGRRIGVESSAATALETMLTDGVRNQPDVSALASRQDRSVEVMVWNYHDDDLPGAPATVELSIDGLANNGSSCLTTVLTRSTATLTRFGSKWDRPKSRRQSSTHNLNEPVNSSC